MCGLTRNNYIEIKMLERNSEEQLVNNIKDKPKKIHYFIKDEFNFT